MTPQEIEKVIQSAHKKLVEHFVNQIEQKVVSDYLKFCFPQFSIDYKQQNYLYTVHLNYEINLGKNRYWKETKSGRLLIERDPKTGEEAIIISISYKSISIYESQLDFELSKDIEILQPLDLLALKKKPSFLKNLFSKGSKQLYVYNEEWRELFFLMDR